ncbi:MAG TPA: hypothetical protein VM056_04270 [Terriglobales bacterium]|nr:hypothetical protein [Terriglobales bacterium]
MSKNINNGKLIPFPSGRQNLVKRTMACGGFEADFFVDTKCQAALYHFIITRKGMAEIVAWGQERSMEEAERAALNAMDYISDRVVKTAV